LVKSVGGALADAQEESHMAEATKTATKAEPEGTAAPVTKNAPEPWDVANAADLLARLNALMADEMWAANYAAADGDQALAAIERGQVELLKLSIANLMAFLESEVAEQFSATPAAEGAAAVEMAVPAGDVQKKGARNSKADAERIQQMHDVAKALGAACAKADAKADPEPKETEKGTEGTVAKVVTPVTPTPQAPAAATPPPADPVVVVEKVLAIDEHPVVKALQSTLTETTAVLKSATDTLAEQKATIAAQAGSLAVLEERLVKLEAQPMPGGPVTRAVEKTLGGVPPKVAQAPAAEAGGDPVLKAFDTLAQAAPTEDERLKYAQQKLAYIRRSSR
jgi:hypothetical protein